MYLLCLFCFCTSMPPLLPSSSLKNLFLHPCLSPDPIRSLPSLLPASTSSAKEEHLVYNYRTSCCLLLSSQLSPSSHPVILPPPRQTHLKSIHGPNQRWEGTQSNIERRASRKERAVCHRSVYLLLFLSRAPQIVFRNSSVSSCAFAAEPQQQLLFFFLNAYF